MMRRGIGFWAHPEFMKFMVSSVVVIGCLVCPLESFASNGVLITAFTNPVPTSFASFGRSVAAVGSDRVLIGAEGYELVITNSAAAFLFSTNGTLLTTLTDPSPGDHMFGHSVAAVFSDKLVVGAPHTDPITVNPGSAYLFSTNGMLLMTVTNPNPARFDNFGWSVTAVGDDA